MAETLLDRAAALPCFRAPDRVEVLAGGRTNRNLLVHDGGAAFVVRFGEDIPVHGILRWHERAVSIAAAEAGVAPPVRHVGPGVMVLHWVDAAPLSDRRDAALMPVLAALIGRVHREVTRAFVGPALAFDVFHILRGYARTLAGSAHAGLLPGLLGPADRLQAAVGPAEVALCHNDLLAGNILIRPGRIWLIDWEYAGFGHPLFDLAGLAAMNGLTPGEERALLEAYFDAPLTDALWHRHAAMKCAALLRETLWSMVSETALALDVDYAAYTAENLAACRAALADFDQL